MLLKNVQQEICHSWTKDRQRKFSVLATNVMTTLSSLRKSHFGVNPLRTNSRDQCNDFNQMTITDSVAICEMIFYFNQP